MLNGRPRTCNHSRTHVSTAERFSAGAAREVNGGRKRQGSAGDPGSRSQKTGIPRRPLPLKEKPRLMQERLAPTAEGHRSSQDELDGEPLEKAAEIKVER